MKRIAFFTLNAYDMLTGNNEGAVGGAQVQQILVGRELASRGHDVYFVEYDDNQKENCTVNRIQVVLKPRPKGNEFRRALTAVRGTTNVLQRINPDVCYRRVLDFEIFPLVGYSAITDTQFVYGVAHDDELTDSPRHFSDGIKSTHPYKWLNRRALSAADSVIVQNNYQQSLAERRLNTRVHKIPNCYTPQEPLPEPALAETAGPIVLWVGRFVEFKQPEIIFKIAAQFPDTTFVIVGPENNRELSREIYSKAQSRDNVRFEGFVPFAEIDRYFVAADVFLNTSVEEGFPNTFLQAWAYETPVASLTVDPDDIITSNDLGTVAGGSIERLVDQLELLLFHDDYRKKTGDNCRRYFEATHTVKSITDRYEMVFFG